MECTQLLKNLTVLLVEDEESLSQLLKEAIGGHFRKFTCAPDGKTGLEKSRTCQPDIVITDITMPIMDGLTMAEAIRQDLPKLPIIVLSAYSDKEKLLHAIDVGITKYFIKPFDPEELLKYICSLAEKLDASHTIKLLTPYHFDLKWKKLYRDGQLINLTDREIAIFHYLLSDPSHMISNEEIKAKIRDGKEISDESVRVFIRRLREKTDKALIKNLPKQGYLLEVES